MSQDPAFGALNVGASNSVVSRPQRLELSGQAIFVAALGLLIVFAAVVGPELLTDPNAQSASRRLLSPSLSHPFGTDELRRDILARTVYGLRTSLLITFVAVLPGATLGTLMGLTAGYFGRLVDVVLMRVLDAWLAFPGLLTALAILTAMGPGPKGVALAIGLFTIPIFMRMARAQAMAERRKEYVMAATVLGAHPVRIMLRHVLPNAFPTLVTQLALSLTTGILLAAALSFLGLGERPPATSLGGLLNSSRPYLDRAWWYVAFPGAVLALVLLWLSFLAEQLSDWLAPSRARHIAFRRAGGSTR